MTALSTLFAALLGGVALALAFEAVSTWRRMRQPLVWAASNARVRQRLAAVAAEDRRTQALPFVGADRRRAEAVEDLRHRA
jgi:uncharacterized membrane protein YecN with MAPEG domain